MVLEILINIINKTVLIVLGNKIRMLRKGILIFLYVPRF